MRFGQDNSALELYAPCMSGYCAANGRARVLSRELHDALTPCALLTIARYSPSRGCQSLL